MKRVKTIVVLSAVLAVLGVHAGDSVPFFLDTTDEPLVTEPIVYDSSWIGGDSAATVVIADNGTEVKRAAGDGEFTWVPSVPGKRKLTYTTYIDGVAQDEVYEAVVYADWKYTVEDGKATIVETTQTSGNVTIPSEIDGYPVVAIGEGVFKDCVGLTGVTILDCVYGIGGSAFSGCANLKEVSLPIGLKTQVEEVDIFAGCSDELEIVYRSAEIKNVTAKQRYPWNGKVDITFEVDGNLAAGFAEENLPVLSIIASNRVDGAVYVADATALSGDTGLAEGTHRVAWDLDAQGIDLSSKEVEFTVAYGGGVNAGPAIDMEGLVAAYLFDGNIADSSENGLHLVDDGGEFTADRNGVENNAYVFSGQAEKLSSTNDYLRGEFSFAFWCKTAVTMNTSGSSSSSSHPGNYVLFPANSGDDAGFGVKVGTDGISVMGHGSYYFATQLSYSSNIGTGWNHVAVTVSSSGTIKLYLNGVCVKTGTKASSRISAFKPMPGGAEYGYYTGNLDDLLIFDKEISSDIVAEIYQEEYSLLNKFNGFDGVVASAKSADAFVDTTENSFAQSTFVYNSSWIGGDSSATVVITDNGTEIKRTSGEGKFTWTPTTVGKHTLTYTTYIDGAAQDEVYEAVVYADWKYTVEDGKATIVETTQTSGNVTIPAEIDGYSVVAIEDGVFAGCDGLTSVTIPFNLVSCVRDIFPNSYDKIENLTMTGEGEEFVGGVFEGCVSLKSIVLPDGIAAIPSNAFAGCAALETVVIPDSVLYMGTGVFEGCDSFKPMVNGAFNLMGDILIGYTGSASKVVIPDDVRGIADGVFANHTEISEVEFPSTLEFIGVDAFATCTLLKAIDLPDSVVAVNDGAFRDCTWVQSVKMSKSLKTIGDAAFANCAYVPSIECADGLEELGVGAFSNLWRMTSMKLPSSLDVIGKDAFWGCESLSAVTVPAHVQPLLEMLPDTYATLPSIVIAEGESELCEDVFAGCAGVSEIVIPSEVEDIPARAFKNCTGLTQVTLPPSLLTIGDEAFSGCSKISSLVFPETLEAIGARAFAGLSLLEVVTIPDGVTAIGSAVFSGCNAVRQVYMPANVATVSATFPDAYSKITSVIVPETTTSIIAGFLSGCSSLTSFDIPAGVTEIGSSAFKNCSALSGVVLPEGLVSIGASAFQNCNVLGSIAIPSTVTSLAAGAFSGCSQVRSVTIPGNVWTLSAIFPNAYKYITTVYVTAGSEKLCDDIFSGCSALTNIEIPTSVTEIGDGAFENCTSLASVGIPAGVTSLGVGAFSGCSVLSSITLPGGLAVLDDQVFKNCANLTEITIPASVTQIGSSVFSGCTSLLSVKFVGNAPAAASGSYDGISASLVTYVPYESTGWDGVSTSMALPKYWPSDAGEGIYAIEELVAAYLFNGDISDSSGNNQNLVDNGGEFTSDRNGDENSAYFFSGEKESLGFAKNYTNEFSFAFWCKTSVEMSAYGSATEGWSSYHGNYVLYPSHGKEAMGLGVKVGTDGIAVVGHGSGYFQTQLTYSSNIGAGWNHIGVTVSSSGNIKIYLNGSCVKTGSNRSSRTPIFNPTPGGGSYGYYTGSIDDLLVFDMEIDSDTVAGIYQDGIEFQQEKNSIAWWDPVHLSVTFDWNYEGGSAETLEQVVDTTYLLPDTDPTRPGAVFAGWWTAQTGGARVTPTSRVMQMQAHTLYAHWKMNEYSVSFDANGGQGTMDSAGMTVDEVKALPACRFRRVNHAFAGWAMEPNGAVVYADGVQVENLSLEEGAVVTLYAAWSTRDWAIEDHLDAPGVTFSGGGDADWVADAETSYDGMSSMRSGVIGDGETSELSTAVVGSGTVSFYWKASCEEAGKSRYDYVAFYVDGEEVAYLAGITDWARFEIAITTPGTHTLTWKYVKDESGNGGEDAAWVDMVEWTQNEYTAVFAAGEGASGTPPESVTGYYGYEMTLPGGDSLSNGEQIFSGWNDGSVTYQPGERYVFGESDVEFVAVWKEKVWSFGDALNCSDITFTSSGDDLWTIDFDVTHDGEVAMRSGDIGDGQTTSIEAQLTGPGTISFWWKVEGEVGKKELYDYADFVVDDTNIVASAGDTDWVQVSYEITGVGPHTVKWVYMKDESDDGDGRDCAWLDEVVWTPAPDPIPELPSTATADEVAAALGGSADAKLAANITDAANYAAYREWALGVKTADGSAVAGVEVVKNAANAWLSYALDTEKLIANAPVEGDVTIDTFEDAATDGAFDFTMNVKDIAVGDGALEANIKKVFDIEGVEDLATGTFSADAVEVNAAAAEGGKVKFTVTPKGEDGAIGSSRPASFFFRVMMK